MEYTKVHTGKYIKPIPKTYFDFQYELDDFQLYGCDVIHSNENLLVTAHTGSGKTALALEAIAKTLSENNKCVYISPIKALSNQKYAEFSLYFNSIGIITGDIKVNPIGDLLIMTAEIFRNAILKTDNSNYEWATDITKIKCVIIDEVHSINLPERGKVWEEIIINLDKNIQLVLLSATISEPLNFIEWIGNLKQVPCHLVSTSSRPIPLHHGIWWDDTINYVLYGDKEWQYNVWNNLSKKINNYFKTNQYNLSIFIKCIKYLFENNMLPANVFLLNRELCIKYAKKIPFTFVSIEEINNIQHIWNNKLHKYKILYGSSPDWITLYDLVIKGIGYHHSGMIPILKEIVEILYSEGYIKLLFATETFAMGVNMPTKTVVFYNTTKYDGNHIRPLKSEEYAQMAGRAGRRGKDSSGTIIIIPYPNFITETEARQMILSPPRVLSSKLTLDYIFILKHINNNILDIYNNSLFRYQEFNNHIYKYKFNDIKEKLNNISISESDITIYNQINDINIKLQNSKLSCKQRNKLTIDKTELESIINLETIKIYFNFTNQIEKLNLIKDNVNINIQINNIILFLQEHNYIIKDSQQLTLNGIVLSEINDCNPFILEHIIFNNYFNNLEFDEIIAICSILINEKHNINNNSKYNLDNSIACKEILNKLDIYITQCIELENILNTKIPYPIITNWTLNYDFFNDVKLWASHNDVKVISGSFIKIILRITNLVRNILTIAKLINNITLINKLYGYEEKLIRDCVVNDSLYI